jgi:hypothetical protein
MKCLLPTNDIRIQDMHRRLCITTPLTQISPKQLAVLTVMVRKTIKSYKKQGNTRK